MFHKEDLIEFCVLAANFVEVLVLLKLGLANMFLGYIPDFFILNFCFNNNLKKEK